MDDEVAISATIRNIGEVSCAEVVQLYLGNKTAGINRPAQVLGGFERVVLEPGETQRVTFTVSARQLGHSNARGGFSVDAGRTDVFIGTNSDDHALSGGFDVVGESRALKSSERSFFSEVTIDASVGALS